MKRGIRVQKGEDLSPAKIEEVIKRLNADKPITKKDACGMLSISYNTTRLTRIIEEYKEKKTNDARLRKELRSKPLSNEDISYIVSSYLEDGNLSLIADLTHRGLTVIKRVLARYNIPLRTSTITYQNPIFLPDTSISEVYTKDDLVYSARYDQPALVSKLHSVSPSHGNVYSIWLVKDEQQALQPYYELGDLRKVQEELGIKLETMKFADMQHQIAQAINDSKRKKK